MARKAAATYGLFAPMPPVSARPPAGDPVQQEMVSTLRDLRYADMITRLRGGGAPVNSQGVPQAASLSEAVTAATGIAALHKGAADTALAMRDAEARRADRLAAETETRVEQARSEGMGMAQLMLTMQQDFTAKMTEFQGQMHQAQLQAAHAEHEARLKDITGRFEGMMSEIKQAMGQKDSQIARLTQERDEARGRPTLEDELMAHLREKGATGWAAAFLGLQKDTPDDPELLYKRKMAEVLGEVHAAKAMHEVEAGRDALRRKGELHEMTKEFMSQGIGVIGVLREVLPGLVNRAADAPPPPGFTPPPRQDATTPPQVTGG